MAETQTTTEAERTHSTEGHPHDGVEVFDTTSSSQGNPTVMDGIGQPSSTLSNHDTPFNSANLLTGDRPAGDFRATDLNNSELSNTNRTGMGTESSIAGQGTNWGTIVTVILVILVIIFIVSRLL